MATITSYALVGLGSALGGMARFFVAQVVTTLRPEWTTYPLPTLFVNGVGCLILSLISEVSLGALPYPTRLLLTTGFCGGFTTYSSFNLEVAQLAQRKGLVPSFVYMAATVLLCLLAHVLGVLLARSVFGFSRR